MADERADAESRIEARNELFDTRRERASRSFGQRLQQAEFVEITALHGVPSGDRRTPAWADAPDAALGDAARGTGRRRLPERRIEDLRDSEKRAVAESLKPPDPDAEPLRKNPVERRILNGRHMPAVHSHRDVVSGCRVQLDPDDGLDAVEFDHAVRR